MKKQDILQSYEKLNKRILALQEDLSRLDFANLFLQYGGDRDIYKSLGYNLAPSFQDFYARYRQQDIAKAIIDKLCIYTWRGDVSVYNVSEEDNEQNSLYKVWNELNKSLRLQKKLLQLDKLAMLGEYACLLLGFNDVKSNEDFKKAVNKGSKLLYVTPLSQSNCEMYIFEGDSSNKRYGQPLFYNVKINNNNDTITLQVHYTRIIHVVYDALDDDLRGVPFLLPIYHRLEDLDKIVGASAEMFWRGARPGYHVDISDNAYADDNEIANKLEQSLTKFEHNLRRFIATQYVDKIESLQQQIADPTNFADVQFQIISAITGIPKRILFGSERGELASTQDKEAFNEVIWARRKAFAEPEILNKLMARLIEVGTIKQTDYTIEWQSVYDEDINQRTERALKLAQAINTFTANPYNEEFMPKETFMRIVLGFTDAQIEEITNDLQNINKVIFSKEKDLENE